MTRSGRRPGASGARDAILDAARATFGEVGYDGATIRAVARRAEVDPALVHHYFGNKEHLFIEAMELPVDPGEVVERLLTEGTEDLGERLARFFLTVWESEDNRGPLMGLIRSAMSNERAAAMLRGFITTAILGRLTRAIDAPNPDLRAALIGAQLVGLAMLRYVVRVEPIVAADLDELVAAAAPTIQRYLDGELSGVPTRADRPA